MATKRFAASILGLAPILLLIAVPMLWAIGHSLAYSLGVIGLFSNGFTLKHWQACLGNSSAASSLALSLYVAATSTFMATGAGLAVVLAWPQCGRNTFLMSTVCLALGTPTVVIALMVMQWLGGGGWIARFSCHLGLIAEPNELLSLAGDRWALGIIAAQFLSSTPLLLLFMSQMWITAKGDRLCELASSLGASTWQAKTSVAAPMVINRSRSLILLTFMFNFGSYEIPLLLGRQSPQMLSVLTQRRTGQFDITQRPESFALASVYFIITATLLIAYLFVRRRDAT